MDVKNNYLKEWLHARQNILSIFSKLTNTQPFNDEYIEPESVILPEFCELLLEYISTAHFKVYLNISAFANCSLNSKLMQTILESTAKITDFCNKYNAKKYSKIELRSDLSNLGESLATRFDLEDILLTPKA